jgi:hypothetical protein
MFGEITIKSRPLRLAFITPPDRAALQKVVEINSTLWGGAFNPIIPLYGRIPEAWRLYPGQKLSVADRVLGYVRAFDPDVIVSNVGEVPEYLRDMERAIISIDDIWAEFLEDGNGVPSYGVGVFEVLNGIYDELFRVVHRFPSKIVLPTFDSRYELFWSAVVGQFPKAFGDVIFGNFSKAIDF